MTRSGSGTGQKYDGNLYAAVEMRGACAFSLSDCAFEAFGSSRISAPAIPKREKGFCRVVSAKASKGT